MTPAELITLELKIFLVLTGALIGSFLNVCIYRIPRGQSIVFPGSRCPKCGAAIKPWNNVPVLAWFWLRGRCADCRAPISIRYPLVEAANAGLWFLALHRYGVKLETVLLLPFLSAMLALFFTDWDEYMLPDKITWPLFVLGLLSAPWNPRLDFAPFRLGAGTSVSRLLSAAAGAALGAGLLGAFYLTWKWLLKREGMGLGDLKLMLGVGAYLGLAGAAITIFIGSIAGALISIPFLLGGRWTSRRELPFGCFLAPTAVMAVFIGEPLLRWYLNLL